MTLWMTLRIGPPKLGLSGGQPRDLPGRRLPDAQSLRRLADLSTQAVHETDALTCEDATVPRIHHAYYDYHSSI